MGTITTSVGLASNLPTGEIIDALINAQRGTIDRLANRAEKYGATSGGLNVLSGNLLSLTGSATTLGKETTFDKLTTTVSNPAILSVAPSPDTPVGTYEFEAIRKATTQQIYSKGFANTDTQTLGEGVITIASGGKLATPTPLDILNEGQGVARGVFRITDGSGASADIDISDAVSVTDVLDLINENSAISVEARAEGDGIILVDTSGQSATDFSVAELNGGHAAEGLGLLKTTAGTTITGDDINTIPGDYTLDLINGGNGLRLIEGAPELRISLTDDPTTEFDVDLDDAVTLQDIADAINDHEDNAGKVLAEVNNGQFTLTDQTGGGGAGSFELTEINDANVLHELGLDVAAVGNTISGERIIGGLDSVLLRNLNGGQGFDQLGSISLTDQSGKTAVVDLSTATSLNDVINAINQAEDTGSKLNLTATFDELGTGIRIIDTTASPSGNLTIADVGGSTLATQLGIAVDAAQSTVESGSLNLQYVNAATSLDGYAPGGGKPQTSAFTITDSAGNTATISLSTSVKNIGDVLQRINSNETINVQAQLNETGDGFELIDLAGGAETLTVQDLGGGQAAQGLRLLGEVDTNEGGQQRISSRLTTEIQIDAEDTLDDIAEKLNNANAGLTAAIIDDGSTLNSKRLVLNSTRSGSEGALILDSEGFDLGLTITTRAEDAVLRIGSNPATAFVTTSSTNRFNTGINALIDIKEVSEDPITVTVQRDQDNIINSVQSFIDSYNRIIDAAADLTKFDPDTGERGVLQGEGIVLRLLRRLDSEVTQPVGNLNGPYRSLVDLGITVTSGGKLQLDDEVLKTALDDNPAAVREFFTATDNGLSDRLETTVDAFTDPFTGAISLQNEALTASLQSIDERIGVLNEILENKRARLVEQYARMETIISELNSQSSAIDRLAALANPGSS
ncbi:flagellar filament capping protein FliD [Symmachiella dynata]|uniref:flagellar filament capping protein FliD n=1 Tax=Symmachiella dynata TaxID=2527995 RepID=UPI0030EF2E69